MGSFNQRGAPVTLASRKTALPSGDVYLPFGSLGNGQGTAFAAQAVFFPRPAAWAGRPVSKWCRYGFWNEDGTELTVTRIF